MVVLVGRTGSKLVLNLLGVSGGQKQSGILGSEKDGESREIGCGGCGSRDRGAIKQLMGGFVIKVATPTIPSDRHK